MADADYADDLKLLVNTTAQAESLLNRLEQSARVNSHYVNANETEFMCFKQEGTISLLNDKPLKLVNQFPYLGSNISSTESDVNIYIEKAQTVIYRLSIIWKSDLFDKIKRDFFRAFLCNNSRSFYQSSSLVSFLPTL